MKTFDAVVLGVGGMGSAALYHLAARGMRVLGLEQFRVGHDRGSSHGETRIIRKAYFEHPAYVPLLVRAYTLWTDFEKETGRRFFYRTGLLETGPADGMLIRGVRRSAELHGLALEEVAVSDVPRRFPGFLPSDDMVAVFEADAGLLLVEQCVQSFARRAVALGAELREDAAVLDWSVQGSDITVRTRSDSYTTSRLVICGGPWAVKLLADLGLPLSVRRKPVFWFEADPGAYDRDRGCPVFCFDTRDGFFYGIPSLSRGSLKIAEHTGGETVPVGADHVDRTVRESDVAPVRRFSARYLPFVRSRVVKSSVCMYTMTPDEHFIMDSDPRYPGVLIATGFSGHGYKFAPLIGSVLADMATGGRTSVPVDFLSLSRPSLRAENLRSTP
jgi:sarcosine oxidase